MNREVQAPGAFPYGQSWDGYSEVEEEREEFEAEQEVTGAFIDAADDDLFYGFDDEDEDDDDLLAALDEALDQVEAEARVEFARSLACPEFDALELIPMADTAYRLAIAAFMGARFGATAPRFSQMVRSFAVADPELGALLQVNLHQSRAFVDKRRAQICWVE